MPCTVALRFIALAAILALSGCKKGESKPATPPEDKKGAVKVGLVTDVGGRGDQSFNDSALRGLEIWAGAKRYTTGGYKPMSHEEVDKSVPEDVRALLSVKSLGVEPVVLQAKQHEDYESNLQLLVEDEAKLVAGVGFMLENAVESVAKKNPTASFLLIDSPILDAKGTPYSLPNVRTVTFREHEGTFLAGALAGLVSTSHVVGFVGGMQIPLIRKFEAGFRAGVQTTNAEAAKNLLVAYTGSFDRVEAGKQVAQDMLVKGADVLFHAAGADGLGAIAAAKEAGKWAIGCDSDQGHVAPDTVLLSVIKHVDLAVYLAARDVIAGKFVAGHIELGLKEGGMGITPLRADGKLPSRDAIAAQLEGLKRMIADGTIKVPATLEELKDFKVPSK